jgi:hypothetical protein
VCEFPPAPACTHMHTCTPAEALAHAKAACSSNGTLTHARKQTSSSCRALHSLSSTTHTCLLAHLCLCTRRCLPLLLSLQHKTSTEAAAPPRATGAPPQSRCPLGTLSCGALTTRRPQARAAGQQSLSGGQITQGVCGACWAAAVAGLARSRHTPSIHTLCKPVTCTWCCSSSCWDCCSVHTAVTCRHQTQPKKTLCPAVLLLTMQSHTHGPPAADQ